MDKSIIWRKIILMEFKPIKTPGWILIQKQTHVSTFAMTVAGGVLIRVDNDYLKTTVLQMINSCELAEDEKGVIHIIRPLSTSLRNGPADLVYG